MSEQWEILYLSTAERDLVDIFEYIHKDNPTVARAQVDRFDEAIVCFR